jgi:hypothetical protein
MGRALSLGDYARFVGVGVIGEDMENIRVVEVWCLNEFWGVEL